MLPGEGAAHDNPLQGLSHIEPRARERRVKRQDPVLQQPPNHVVGEMPRKARPRPGSDGGPEQAWAAHRTTTSAARSAPGDDLRQGDAHLPAGSSPRASGWLATGLAARDASTPFGVESTPLARTAPVAGRNRVKSLAVPPRTYSWGCTVGLPSRCQSFQAGEWLDRDRLHPGTTVPVLLLLPLRTPTGSRFFFVRLGILDLHRPGFAHADGRACRTPGARLAITIARLLQHLADGRLPDLGRSFLAQGPFERFERPGGRWYRFAGREPASAPG